MAIITIGGNMGSGKTVTAKRLANTLGYDELYIGGIFRDMARERGLSIEQFYAELKNDSKLEQSVDERQSKLMLERDNLVVQGRVAWFFSKGSPFSVFNIFLAVDPVIGAKRSAKRKENAGKTLAQIVAANEERGRTELERYRLLYGIENFLDPGHYDFVLDTAEMDENEVLGKIIEKLHERIEPDI